MSTPVAVRHAADDMQEIVQLTACGMHACVYTTREPGKQSVNEDALAIVCCGDDNGLAMVADGLGGMRAGDAAAALLVDELIAAATQSHGRCDRLRDAVLDGIERAHGRIGTEVAGGATTAALVQISDGEVRPYHVGDSAVLVTGQRGRIKHLSVAHSPVGYAVESGILDEQDALHHEERHLILNAVGIEPMHIDIGPVIRLGRYDTVLIASDGVFDNLHVEEIVGIIRKGDLQQAAIRLTQECSRRMSAPRGDSPHKPDDMSYILLRPA